MVVAGMTSADLGSFLAAAALVLVLVLFTACVEMFRDIEQLRNATGMIDRPTPIDLGPALNRRASEVGLPAHLDGTVESVVVLLSARCGTCRSIAAAVRDRVPGGIYLVLIEPASEFADKFIDEFGLDRSRLFVDSALDVPKLLGEVPTPSAVFISNGRVTRGETVPSSRQFWRLVPTSQQHSSTKGSHADE
jgi:hypothetical protein